MSGREIGDAIMELHAENMRLLKDLEEQRARAWSATNRAQSLAQFCPHETWEFHGNYYQPTWPAYSMRCALCHTQRPTPP